MQFIIRPLARPILSEDEALAKLRAGEDIVVCNEWLDIDVRILPHNGHIYIEYDGHTFGGDFSPPHRALTLAKQMLKDHAAGIDIFHEAYLD